MTHLRTLDISGNKLHDLPHEVCMPPVVRSCCGVPLTLCSCHGQISELTGIRHFRANSNRLRALPLSFVKLFDGFISFDVSRNPLTVRTRAHIVADTSNSLSWVGCSGPAQQVLF